MRPVRFIAPAILLSVAGCAALGLDDPTAPAPPPAVAKPAPATSSPAVAGIVPLPREKPPTPPAPRPAAVTPTPVTPLPEAAPPARPAERTPPRTLVGLSQEETTALLGPPASESVAGAAKVWRYQTAQCRLDVQFFLDVSRNAFYALDYAAAGQDTSATARDRCLREIVNDRRQP